MTCHMIFSQSCVVASQTKTWDVTTGASYVTTGYRWITWPKCDLPAHRSDEPPDPTKFTTEEADVTCEDCLAALAKVVINARKAAVI